MTRRIAMLGLALAYEFGVPLDEVVLLRHFKGKLKAMHAAGATLTELTLTQPKDTPYDYRAAGRPPIQLVASIGDNVLRAVFRIDGIEVEGPSRVFASEQFRNLDDGSRLREGTLRRFKGTRLDSQWVGGAVQGWSNVSQGVARAGGQLFNQVIITAPRELLIRRDLLNGLVRAKGGVYAR